jgi:hypothetical protein
MRHEILRDQNRLILMLEKIGVVVVVAVVVVGPRQKKPSLKIIKRTQFRFHDMTSRESVPSIFEWLEFRY